MTSVVKNLFDTVLADDLNEFRRILSEHGHELDWRNLKCDWERQEAPMHLAANRGQDAMVKLLLEAGCDVNRYTMYSADNAYFNLTALHVAALSNKLSTVGLLLEMGANPRLQGHQWGAFSGDVLQWAEALGHDEVVELLKRHVTGTKCKQGLASNQVETTTAKVKQTSPRRKTTPVAPTNLNQQTPQNEPTAQRKAIPQGRTILTQETVSLAKRLHLAVNENDLSKLRKLLISAEDIPGENNLGRKEWNCHEAPLQHAAYLGRAAMVRLLVLAGCDINSYSWCAGKGGTVKAKATALHWAVAGGRTSVVELLLDLGADETLRGYNKQNCSSGTPLDWARRKGQDTIILILQQDLSGNDNPSYLDLEEGQTPFEKSRTDKVKLKSAKERELEEALGIRERISSQEAISKDLSEKINNLQERLDSLRKEKLQVDKEIQKMKESIEFKSPDDIRTLLKQIEEIEELLRNDRYQEHLNCPICFEQPQHVWGCTLGTCEYWVCGKCRQHTKSCPSCRCNFGEHPPRRYRAVERLLAAIGK